MPAETPNGDQIRLSGYSQLCLPVGDSYVDTDDGIHPTYYLKNETMYDVEKLLSFLHGLVVLEG